MTAAYPPPHPVYGPDAAPVRLGTADDLPACLALDDSYTTTRVWQMDRHPLDPTLAGPAAADELDDWLGAIFRPVRLPRPLPVLGDAATLPHEARLARWHAAAALLVVGPRPSTPPTPEDTEAQSAIRNPQSAMVEVWGYALLGLDRAAGRAQVAALAVGAAHRGQGLGGRLLDAAKAWAAAPSGAGGAGDLPALEIHLAPKNAPAIAFCRRRGFLFCGYSDYTAAGGDLLLAFLCPLR